VQKSILIKYPLRLDAMNISRRDRIFGSVSSAAIFGVFAGATWFEGNMPVTWIFISLGIVFTLFFQLASDSALKVLGSLW
jgi:hypothetical protein